MRTAVVAASLLIMAACSNGSEGSGPVASSSTTALTIVPFSTVPNTTAPITAPDLPIEEALRLGEGGLGRARFGDSDTKVEGYLRAILLAPDDDTDWGKPDSAYGTCPGTEVRVLRWGWLVVFFADRSSFGAGRRHFIGWRYGPEVDTQALYPEGLSTALGLAPGMTVRDLKKTFEATELTPARGSRPPGFRIGESFRGSLTGLGDDDVVVVVEAGADCPL
ncbi:MAG TPA: hypothetical protein VF855_08470 [Acidimicrobiales bacterium]